jgi:uncharacterized protein
MMPRSERKQQESFEEPLIQIVPTGRQVALADHPVLVIGFPGPGLVGMIAIARMIEAMNMEVIAAIRSPLVPPVTPFYGGILRLPIRICASRDGRFLATISEVPLPFETLFFVANRLLDWAEHKGVQRVMCLEGVAVQKREGAPEVFGAAESGLLEELEKFEVQRVQKGLVAGIAGALLNECLIRKMDGYCLLVPAIAEVPDPEAAASILTTVNRFFKIDISVQPLLANRSAIKSQLNELAQEAQRKEQENQEKGFRPIPFYV